MQPHAEQTKLNTKLLTLIYMDYHAHSPTSLHYFAYSYIHSTALIACLFAFCPLRQRLVHCCVVIWLQRLPDLGFHSPVPVLGAVCNVELAEHKPAREQSPQP